MDLLNRIFTDAWILWSVIGIALMLCEGLTPGTFSLFFGGLGAFATSAVCYFYPSVAVSGTQQLLIFSAMSVFSLLLIRPKIIRRIYNKNKFKQNTLEELLGKHAKALTNLTRNRLETGKALFEGTEWSAVPIEDSPDIPAGSTVTVVQIDGLTLKVKLTRAEK